MTEEKEEKKKLRCDLCKKYDYYHICQKCYNDYLALNSDLVKEIKKESSELKQSLSQLIEKNSAKSKLQNKKLFEENQIEKLKKFIERKKEQLLIKQTKLSEMQKIKEEKEKSIIEIQGKITKNNQLKNGKNFVNFAEKKMLIVEQKKKFAKKLFEVIIIKSNSHLDINDFIEEKNKDESTISILSLSKTGDYSLIQLPMDNEEIPFQFKKEKLTQEINCLKYNQFINSIVFFLKILSKKLNFQYPYEVEVNNSITTKENKNYPLMISYNPKGVQDSKVKDVLFGGYLLNINFCLITQDIFGKYFDDNENRLKWFDYSEYVDNVFTSYDIFEEIYSVGESSQAERKRILECNGFEIVENDF